MSKNIILLILISFSLLTYAADTSLKPTRIDAKHIARIKDLDSYALFCPIDSNLVLLNKKVYNIKEDKYYEWKNKRLIGWIDDHVLAYDRDDDNYVVINIDDLEKVEIRLDGKFYKPLEVSVGLSSEAMIQKPKGIINVRKRKDELKGVESFEYSTIKRCKNILTKKI